MIVLLFVKLVDSVIVPKLFGNNWNDREYNTMTSSKDLLRLIGSFKNTFSPRSKKDNKVIVKLLLAMQKCGVRKSATIKQKKLFAMASEKLLPQLFQRAENNVIWRKFESIFSSKASNSNMKKLHNLKPCYASQCQAIADCMAKTLESFLSGNYPKLLSDENIDDKYILSFFVKYCANCLRYIVFPRQELTEEKKNELAKKNEVSAVETVIISETLKDYVFDVLKKLSETFSFEELKLWALSIQGFGKKAFLGYSKEKTQGYKKINMVNIVAKELLVSITNRRLCGKVVREIVNCLTA